ncbi:hypothetical protein JD276_12945 [Leucobacter sp. CSA1]|uniref:Histone deacetylase domain-containing protein n=1 Tax=Leucobacter chromiisoli TaxID=2796471 RepID=A0A934Q9E9_9MICO|nr:hypothetical protein [Leucobacter chromiisoli]MBK0419938.1 hypothetical protein [Leucobacter chromiisoli]
MNDRRLAIYWDERVLLNDTGHAFGEVPPSPLIDVQQHHVENSDRVRDMVSVLERGPIAEHLDWRPGRLAASEEIAAVHPRGYVEEVQRFIEAGGGYIEENTVLSAEAWVALRAAVGTSLEAVDAVMAGDATRAYALVRPPGHHAQPAQAEGYGVFNHAAIMAERARTAGAERVAIVDWDVHHGNGTQEFFYERSDVLYVSMHMRHGTWSATHPQTGSPAEIGVGPGAGYNVNVELPLGSGDAAYQRAWHRIVAPVLEQYEPDLLILSSGQDASAFDPNGRQNLSMAGFHALSRLFLESAERLTQGRFVAVQEGGYHLSYAPYCVHATCEGLLGRDPELEDPIGYLPDHPDQADAAIGLVHTYLSRFWRFDNVR